MAHADALGDLQPDAAGADHAEDGGGPRVALEKVQRLRQHHGGDLRQDAEADGGEPPAPKATDGGQA